MASVTKTMEVVARLDVISVRKLTAVTITASNIMRETPCNKVA